MTAHSGILASLELVVMKGLLLVFSNDMIFTQVHNFCIAYQLDYRRSNNSSAFPWIYVTDDEAYFLSAMLCNEMPGTLLLWN